MTRKHTWEGDPREFTKIVHSPLQGVPLVVGAPWFYRTMKHHVYFVWNFLIKIVFCNLRFHILFHLKSPRNLSNLQLRWVSVKTLRTVTLPKRFIASKAGGVGEEKKKKKRYLSSKSQAGKIQYRISNKPEVILLRIDYAVLQHWCQNFKHRVILFWNYL